MLFSELRERENRFKLALKIGFPFLLLISIYIVAAKFYLNNNKDIFLLGFLSFAYIYYIFYLIYRGFNSTLIDPITKTYNRTYMLKILKKWMSKNNATVVMLRVSNINDINDRYGMLFGDKILHSFAKNLFDFLYEKGFEKAPIGRYGGGYFLILLQENETALKHLFNIFQRLEKSEESDGIELKIEVAMTSTKYDSKKENIISHLLSQFDYNEDDTLMKPDVYDKLVIKAIDDQNFLFHYQPILDLKTKRISIYDILVKLYVKEFGNLTLNQIIPVLNRNNLERKFNENVITSFLKATQNVELDVLVCINIDANILRSSAFLSFIQHNISENRLKPEKFILSFSEKKSYEEIKRFNEILSQYKQLGFHLLINQFGGNNAGIEYLKHLPVDYVSFDLEFTKNIKKPKIYKMLQSYIELMKKIEVTSISKFIETPYIYETMQKMGVDMLQGYMIGKPKPIGDKNDNPVID